MEVGRVGGRTEGDRTGGRVKGGRAGGRVGCRPKGSRAGDCVGVRVEGGRVGGRVEGGRVGGRVGCRPKVSSAGGCVGGRTEGGSVGGRTALPSTPLQRSHPSGFGYSPVCCLITPSPTDVTHTPSPSAPNKRIAFSPIRPQPGEATFRPPHVSPHPSASKRSARAAVQAESGEESAPSPERFCAPASDGLRPPPQACVGLQSDQFRSSVTKKPFKMAMSCVHCQKSHQKCIFQKNAHTCNRCLTRGLTCVFKPSSQGQRSDLLTGVKRKRKPRPARMKNSKM